MSINVTNHAADVNHLITKGDNFDHTVTIKEDGVLVNISSDEFFVIITNNAGKTLHTLAIGSGIVLVSTGVVKYSLTAAQTEALNATEKLPYKFKWVRAGGYVKTLERGFFENVKDLEP